MGVDHGGFGFGMAKKDLDVTEVYAFFKEVGGVGVAEHVWGDALVDVGALGCCGDNVGNGGGAVFTVVGSFYEVDEGAGEVEVVF